MAKKPAKSKKPAKAKQPAKSKQRLEKPDPVANVFRLTMHIRPARIEGFEDSNPLIDEIELFVIATDDVEARNKAIAHAENTVRFIKGLEGGYAFRPEQLHFVETEFVARVDVA